MDTIIKNILWGFILSAPICVGFAADSPYMDKINQMTEKTKSDLHSKYDLPPISQYLSSSGAGSSPTQTAPSTSNGSMPSAAPVTPESSIPSGETSPSTSGSWYVQPGDTSSESTGSGSTSSGSSKGFDHSNIY